MDPIKKGTETIKWLDANQLAEVIFLPAMGDHIDLHALLANLAGRGCNQVLVEAGAGLAGAFIAEGLLDELVCYWAPKLFGNEARPMFDLSIETIDAHLALSIQIQQLNLAFSPAQFWK